MFFLIIATYFILNVQSIAFLVESKDKLLIKYINAHFNLKKYSSINPNYVSDRDGNVEAQVTDCILNGPVVLNH